MRRDKSWIILWLLALLSGCTDGVAPGAHYGTIQFGAGEVALSSRAFVDQEGIDSGNVPVYVHGIINGSTRLYPVSGTSQGELLTQDYTTAKWLPSTRNNYKDWVAGSTYAFNGYAYTPSTASTSMLSIRGYGKEITVNQPATYQPDQMVDYLLSHTFSVADGRMRPVVQLDMEHAMALVEVRVVKHESIREAYVDNLTMGGFFRSATMNCTTPAPYNSGATNEWKISLSGVEDTLYTIDAGEPDDESSRVAIKERDEEGGVSMMFLAIPQQMERSNVLSISYWVNEKFDDASPDNFVHHEASFNLYNYTPIMWSSAHHIIYTLEVDTGIHLQGVIAPWIDVDYIEGTVLPDIDNKE